MSELTGILRKHMCVSLGNAKKTTVIKQNGAASAFVAVEYSIIRIRE